MKKLGGLIIDGLFLDIVCYIPLRLISWYSYIFIHHCCW